MVTACMCFGDIYRKSVRQFDRFVDMALNMAISNFEDLNRKKSNWGQKVIRGHFRSKGYSGSFEAKRLLGSIEVIRGHLPERSLVRLIVSQQEFVKLTSEPAE